MKSSILVVALLLAAGCKSSKKAETASTPAADVQLGRIEKIYQVLDKETRQRVGFLEKTRYDKGAVLYMVRGTDRGVSKGYVLPNNVAFRYVFIDGRRTQGHDNLGADTINANARKILGYDRPVELEQTSIEALAAELEARKAESATQPAPGIKGEGDSEEE